MTKTITVHNHFGKRKVKDAGALTYAISYGTGSYAGYVILLNNQQLPGSYNTRQEAIAAARADAKKRGVTAQIVRGDKAKDASEAQQIAVAKAELAELQKQPPASGSTLGMLRKRKIAALVEKIAKLTDQTPGKAKDATYKVKVHGRTLSGIHTYWWEDVEAPDEATAMRVAIRRGGQGAAVWEIRKTADRKIRDHWTVSQRVGSWKILQGAGVDGGDWAAQDPRGKIHRFDNKANAVEHAEMEQPDLDHARDESREAKARRMVKEAQARLKTNPNDKEAKQQLKWHQDILRNEFGGERVNWDAKPVTELANYELLAELQQLPPQYQNKGRGAEIRAELERRKRTTTATFKRSPKDKAKDVTMIIAQAKAVLNPLGMEIKKTAHDEYRVNFKGGSEATAGYESDITAAVGTGKAMAARLKGRVGDDFILETFGPKKREGANHIKRLRTMLKPMRSTVK